MRGISRMETTSSFCFLLLLFSTLLLYNLRFPKERNRPAETVVRIVQGEKMKCLNSSSVAQPAFLRGGATTSRVPVCRSELALWNEPYSETEDHTCSCYYSPLRITSLETPPVCVCVCVCVCVMLPRWGESGRTGGATRHTGRRRRGMGGPSQQTMETCASWRMEWDNIPQKPSRPLGPGSSVCPVQGQDVPCRVSGPSPVSAPRGRPRFRRCTYNRQRKILLKRGSTVCFLHDCHEVQKSNEHLDVFHLKVLVWLLDRD